MNKLIYKQFRINISTKQMADVMYAIIMTKAVIKSTHGVGIYEYTRSQNKRNGVHIMVGIPIGKLIEFMELAGVELSDPIKPVLN